MDSSQVNMADGLISQLGDVMKMAENAMNMLPNECKVAIPNAQMDVHNAKNMLNSGDSSGLSELLKKYANSNNK